MDYYPQPRPVLYGTSSEEAPPRTQTAPVRIGPPRYPPAPPSAGYAPEPHDPHRRRPLRSEGEKGRAPGAVLYTFTAAIAYSLLQVLLTAAGFAVGLAAPLVMLVQIAISLVVLACLWMLGGREYLMAVGLLAVHISLGVAFAQWQSPLLWAAIAVTLYLLRPSMLRWYGWMAVDEIRMDIARHSRHYRRRCAHPSFRQPPRPDLSGWRNRW